MRAAIIINHVVENVVVAESGWAPPTGTLVELPDDSPVSAGWTYDGSEFAPPPVVVRALTMSAFDFQMLFTNDELVAIQTSLDPLVIRFRTGIQTIREDVRFDDARVTQGVGYLALIGVITPERAATILAGERP